MTWTWHSSAPACFFNFDLVAPSDGSILHVVWLILLTHSSDVFLGGKPYSFKISKSLNKRGDGVISSQDQHVNAKSPAWSFLIHTTTKMIVRSYATENIYQEKCFLKNPSSKAVCLSVLTENIFCLLQRTQYLSENIYPLYVTEFALAFRNILMQWNRQNITFCWSWWVVQCVNLLQTHFLYLGAF